MASVLILNGPNLNLLGTRKPEVYGTTTLADVEKLCTDAAAKLSLDVDFKQSNHEGQLIDWIHETGAAVKAGQSIGAVFNPGTFTHTSVALHDAIEGASLPLIECHISNVHKREAFRHHSFVSPVASGIIVGFGVYGYVLAIQGLHQLSQAG
jgi:3-dehydroquinate dehydratase-2